MINEKVYAANKDRSAADVKHEAAASWDRLEAAIEACSEQVLTGPHPRNARLPVWQTVPANGHGHLAEHLRFKHLDEGDEAEAEAAQVWAHDVDFAAFSDPRPRAYSDYNLACFYGVVGRGDRAAELLKRSFEGAPELVEVARRDSDFDRVRNSDQVRELLAE